MKINLIFKEWTKKGKSIGVTSETIKLSNQNFHSGATFQGSIYLDAWDEAELREALEKGFQPVFLVNP